MMMMISKMDNSVWDFGGLPPTLPACIKRKASIWHTRWFIFVMPKEKKEYGRQKDMFLLILILWYSNYATSIFFSIGD